MPEEKSGNSGYKALWAIVAGELEKNDPSANKVAVLETEKIFQEALAERKLPGKNIDDRIRNYSHLFSDPDKLRYARAMHKKLISKAGFDISPEDAREIIKGYREAVLDLEKVDFKGWTVKERLGLFLRRHFYSFPKKAKDIFLALLSLSVLTFILTETETGRSFSQELVEINNYLFYKIIPALLIFFAAGLIVLAALYGYQKKK